MTNNVKKILSKKTTESIPTKNSEIDDDTDTPIKKCSLMRILRRIFNVLKHSFFSFFSPPPLFEPEEAKNKATGEALTLWIHSLGPTFDSLRARTDKEIEEEGPYNLDDFSPLDKETMELLNQVNEALNDDEYSEEDKKTIQLLDKVNKLTKSINTVTEEELDPSSTIESKIR